MNRTRITAFLKDNWLLWVISILSLILAYLTFHGDTFYVALFSSNLLTGSFDYSKVSGLVEISQRPYDLSIFPPAAQYVDGFFYGIFYLLGIYNFDLYAIEKTLQTPQTQTYPIPLLGLLLKLRYLLVFYATVFVIGKVASLYEKDSYLRNSIKALWITCPILLYSVFMQGNNDIYPVLFLLLFLWFAFKKQFVVALIFLGISAAIKNFSLFLVLPIAIILAGREYKKIILYASIPGIVYTVSALGFLKYTYHFLTAGTESFYITQNLLPNNVIIFPFAYLLIIFYLYFSEKTADFKDKQNFLIVKYSFLILSLFFVTSYFHPQWFLWVMPFFILLIYNSQNRFLVYLLICTSFFVVLFGNWDKNLDFSLFKYVFPIVTNVEPFEYIISRRYPMMQIPFVLHTIFIASYVFFMYLVVREGLQTSTRMKQLLLYTSILPVIVFLGLNTVYVIGYLAVRNRYWYSLQLEQQTSTNFLSVDGVQPFTQSFVSPKGKLKGVNLITITGDQGVSGEYELILYAQDCKTEITRSQLAIVKAKNGDYLEVLFPIQSDSANKAYCFTVTQTSEPSKNPLKLPLTNQSTYQAGTLTIGEVVSEEDIVFQLNYSIK